MNLAALSLSLPLAALGLAALAGCNHSMSENHETTPERTGDASLTIMTFNVENLFDNVDDPGKEDRTYLALADKQSAEHKAACSEIQVDRWREQCLDWDWSDDIIEQKLAVVAGVILQVGGGRGHDWNWPGPRCCIAPISVAPERTASTTHEASWRRPSYARTAR
jgi:hypothetical protein